MRLKAARQCASTMHTTNLQLGYGAAPSAAQDMHRECCVGDQGLITVHLLLSSQGGGTVIKPQPFQAPTSTVLKPVTVSLLHPATFMFHQATRDPAGDAAPAAAPPLLGSVRAVLVSP
jgi:hypothetical protein